MCNLSCLLLNISIQLFFVIFPFSSFGWFYVFLMLPLLIMAAIISLSLLFLMYSLHSCIDASTQSSMLMSPLSPPFLDTYSLCYLFGAIAHCHQFPWGCPHGVMVKVMDCRIIVSEFKLQSRYYIHYWKNTLGKGMNPLIFPAMG